MLTETTILGIRFMVLLGLRDRAQPLSPRHVAGVLGASPSYLMKTTGMLVKANVLRAHRGVQGGVSLSRAPAEITLLEIVEACQGRMLGDYCSEAEELVLTCAFHRAMAELHESMVCILSRWTLSDLIESPCPVAALRPLVQCRINLDRSMGTMP